MGVLPDSVCMCAVLRIEPRALNILGQCSAIQTHLHLQSPSFFQVSVFSLHSFFKFYFGFALLRQSLV